MRKKLNVALLLVAAVMGSALTFGAAPAAAEEDLGTVNSVTEWGSFRYRMYQYPSKVSSFFFYPESFVKFDIRNGKFFSIESPRFTYKITPQNDVDQILGMVGPQDSPEKFNIIFYTPDMVEIGRMDGVRPNRMLSMPVSGQKHDRLVVRLECHSEANWDVKFSVWEPVDSVVAEPIHPPQVRE